MFQLNKVSIILLEEFHNFILSFSVMKRGVIMPFLKLLLLSLEEINPSTKERKPLIVQSIQG